MARPQKEGLDYFPLDVDIDQDDKVALIEAQHGVTGFAVVIKLLMKIYKNGYFYQWTEKEQLLFSRGINVNINELKEVVNDCIKWGLFSQKIYENERILTSKGIQLRYLEATTRRQQVKIQQEHLLICSEKVNEYKNISIEGVNVDINSRKENINPQSKVKESKVNKTKEKEDKYANEFAQFWSLYPRKLEKKKALTKFKTVRKNHSLETILEGTKKYAQQVKDTDKQFIKHPSTFLNNESFVDGYEEQVEQPKPRPIIVEQTESPIAAFWE
jgi:hypothetical protein